jgi:environmental stress-induced protein Ves
LQLQFHGHGNCLLDPRKRGTRFEGDWATRCAVPEGRCTDLSLIVRKGQAARPAAVVRAPRLVRVKSTARLVLGADLYSAIFILEGSVAVTESQSARPRALRAQDSLLVPPGDPRTLRLRRLGQSTVKLVLLRWRPGRPALRDSAGLPPA